MASFCLYSLPGRSLARTDLYVARPMVLERGFVDGPGASYQDYNPPMRIQLNDPEVILDFIMKLHEELYLENIQLDGVLFGVNDYFSIREFAAGKMSWSSKRDDQGFKINGVRILLDPMRDEGAPVAVFSENDAIKVMSMRRKS